MFTYETTKTEIKKKASLKIGKFFNPTYLKQQLKTKIV